MRKHPNEENANRGRLKIGYIASHAYRLTFEINEIIELLRQRPDTRVYSFYREKGPGIQRRRLAEVPGEILSWSYASIVRSAGYFVFRSPLRLTRTGLKLMWRSRSNPVYWVKNLVVFFIALPILCDARRQGVTHLHADFGTSPATIAWLGKEMLGVGMSVTFHAFDIYSTALGYRDPLKKIKLEEANLVVSVHEDGRRVLRGLVPSVDESKFEVIRISVAFDPEDKPDSLPEPPVIVAVGNFVPKKGFDVLIRAVGSLKRRGVDTRLRIFGDGEERPALESLVRKESLVDCVEFPGYIQHEELPGQLAEAAVFAVPSVVASEGQRDGIPTVVVEAWLSQTPVVASLVGGMAEVIVDGKTGLVFDAGDAEQLADCIERIITDKELRKVLAAAGREKAHRWFSPAKNVRSLVRHIQNREGYSNGS